MNYRPILEPFLGIVVAAFCCGTIAVYSQPGGSKREIAVLPGFQRRYRHGGSEVPSLQWHDRQALLAGGYGAGAPFLILTTMVISTSSWCRAACLNEETNRGAHSFRGASRESRAAASFERSRRHEGRTPHAALHGCNRDKRYSSRRVRNGCVRRRHK